MTAIVIDASVAVKWLLGDEEHVPQALALRRVIISRDLTVAVPPIFPFEVAHTLVRAARRGRLGPDQLERGLRAVVDLGFEVVADPEVALAALDLASRLGTSAYDAAYLAVAIARRATFVTADRPLHDTALAAGQDVAWLGDLPA